MIKKQFVKLCRKSKTTLDAMNFLVRKELVINYFILEIKFGGVTTPFAKSS